MSAPSAPNTARVFSYGDEAEEDATAATPMADTFFDDDLTIEDAGTASAVGSASATFGTLHIAAAADAEEEKNGEHARSAADLDEFKIGGDGGAESDKEDEEEVVANPFALKSVPEPASPGISSAPREESATSPNPLSPGPDDASPGPDAFDNAVLRIDDEDDVQAGGVVTSGPQHSMNKSFSDHLNPLAAENIKRASMLVAGGGAILEGSEADGDEFADNAIAGVSSFNVEPPSPALPDDQAALRMVITADAERELEGAATSPNPDGAAASSPGRHHHQASLAQSRVFSYGDDAEEVAESSEAAAGGTHLRLAVHSRGPSMAVDSTSPLNTPLNYRDIYATADAPLSSSDGSPSPEVPVHRDSLAEADRKHAGSFLSAPGSTVGARSPSPLRRVSGGHRPSISTLAPHTVHNRTVSIGGSASNLASPEKHVRRLSHLLPSEAANIPAELRPKLEELLSVTEVKTKVGFPYKLIDAEPRGKDFLPLHRDIPSVVEPDVIRSFVEPPLGSVSSIKNEETKHVTFNDTVIECLESPTRFTRPPRRREIKPEATIKGLSPLVEEMKRGGSHAQVECIILFGERKPGLTQEVGDLVSQCPNVETLQLQECKMRDWAKPVALPKLLNLDARHCKIKNEKQVLQLVLNSPHLYSLTLTDNPLCEKFGSKLPPFDHSIWKQLLLRLPSLEWFNLLPIDGATRAAAYLYTKSKKLFPIVASTLWNTSLNSVPAIQQMQQTGAGWQPQEITQLDFSGHALLSAHLFVLRSSLQVLDLSHNNLTTLIGSGIHLCTQLKSVKLSNNKLAAGFLDEICCFGQLPLLRQLWLTGNPGLDPNVYPSLVVYYTRHCLGVNRTPGLSELDGSAVTPEQRVAAVERHAPNGKAQAQKERWRLMLVHYLGHRQLLDHPDQFAELNIVNRPELTFADVGHLTGVQSLTLRSCKLKTVEGLELLTSLRFLDVRFNPELQHKSLINQVKQLGASIEWVSLARTEEEAADFDGLRFQFLSALVPHCAKLCVLDHREIAVYEYVRVFTKERKLDKDSPSRLEYVLHLALTVGNTPLVGRHYDLESLVPDVVGKSQVFTASVRTLSLSGLRLPDFPLPNLPSLTELNISFNRFTTIASLNLVHMPELLYLDCRHNKIKFQAQEIASAIGHVPKLHALALGGNPNYTPRARQKLMTLIPQLASLECALRVIDVVISTEDRVQAWGVASHLELEMHEGEATDASGEPVTQVVPEAEVAPGRHNPSASVYQAPVPEGADQRQLTRTLKFNREIRDIHELAKRTLQKQHEAHITVDHRNRLGSDARSPSVKELVSPSGAPDATSPSAAGVASPSGAASPSSDGAPASPTPAPALASRLVALHHGGVVRSGSNAPLPGSAAAKARAAAQREEQVTLEKNIFRFHLLLQDACPPDTESQNVKELALMGMQLGWVDFHPFHSLTKLLISRNNLTSLAHSGIETLTSLRVLHAANNRLSDLGEAIAICNELPQLQSIAFMANPFVAFDAGVAATVEASRAQQDAKSPASSAAASAFSKLGQMAEDALRINLLTPEKYRLTFIGHLQQLQSPGRALVALDFQPVSEDEVIRGLKVLGHSAMDRELFRWNSIVHGMDGMNPEFTILALPNRKLARADFRRFPHLTALDASNNFFEDSALLDSHLTSLQSLTELQIDHNKLKSMRLVAKLVQQLPKLRILKCSHNPGYLKGDAEKSRKFMLACFDNVHHSTFHLEFLNGMKIGVDERIEAMHYAHSHYAVLHAPPVAGRGSVDLMQQQAAKGKHELALPEEEKLAVPAATPKGKGRVTSPSIGSKQRPSLGATPEKKVQTREQIVVQGGAAIDPEADPLLQAEHARFVLTVHERNASRQAKELELKKANLRTLGDMHLGIASFENLVVLDLRENHLTDLSHSGIHLLSHLKTLDLRINEFPSITDIVVSLRPCNALEVIFLQFATKAHEESATPAHYANMVFSDLRGIKKCDELVNSKSIHLDPLSLSAQQLLWKLARVGPNNLKRVDMHNRRLPTQFFYKVLSPLFYLDIRELNAGGNNEWCLHPQYSDVIILLLGPKFTWLDGVTINDQRRMLAYRADKLGKESGKITGNVVLWEDQHEKIHAEVDEWLSHQRAAAEAAAEQNGAGEGGSGGGGGKKKTEHDLRVDLPNMQSINVNSAGAAAGSSGSGGGSAMSSVLNKIDIFIHYLQVYGMVLVMDINIPYPQAFKDFSTWIRLSTLDLKDIFHLDEEYKQDVLFAIIMLVPAVFLALYFYFERLRGQQREWADSYAMDSSSRWNTVKWRTFCLYLLAITISTACCFLFIDDFETIRRFREGGQPTPASLTWALILFCFFTIWYRIWFKVVRAFQKHWRKDRTEHKIEFQQKWLTMIHWAQIIVLFAITALYLPIARVILIQFACDKTNPEIPQSLVNDGQACFPDKVARVHYAAFVFAVLYIVCLPIFLVRLIREGISIVMELNNTYDHLGKEMAILGAEIKQMKKLRSEAERMPDEPLMDFKARQEVFTKNIQEHRELIETKRKQQEKTYFNSINDPVRKLASTSLYAAYEYRWRFWKLIQLVQNLTLVCVSLFVPTMIGEVSEARLLIGGLVILGSFIFVAYIRPFYDNVEDGMEICAGLANTITVAVALGLKYELSWLTEGLANVILLVANVAAVCAFIVCLIVVPCRIYRQKRKVRKLEKESEDKLAALNEDAVRSGAKSNQADRKQASPDAIVLQVEMVEPKALSKEDVAAISSPHSPDEVLVEVAPAAAEAAEPEATEPAAAEPAAVEVKEE